jgi:hypothetical protein
LSPWAVIDGRNRSMALLRSLPENGSLADLRRTYADLLEKLRPYGHRLMRGALAVVARRTGAHRRIRVRRATDSGATCCPRCSPCAIRSHRNLL